MTQKISGKYSNILKNIVDDDVDFISSNFNVNNKFIITQELCDFETDISLSNNNIKDVGTISPCTQINVGNLTLQGNTINNSSGANLLINNVQKINNKSLPSGDFFGKEDQLTLSQIPNALITKEKIADAAITLPKIASISANSLLGNNTGSLATPMILEVSEVKTMLSLSDVENTRLSTWTGSTNLTVFGTPYTFTAGGLTLNSNTLSSTITNSNIILTPNGTGNVSISANLSMNTKNITGVGNINGLTLPSTNFVGLTDFQTITNKTIDAIQLTDSTILSSKFANNSLTLAKMQTIPTNTIIGNNTASGSIPLALTANEVKTMLGITTSTITLSGDISGTGSSSISTTIGAGVVTNTKLGVKSVTLDKITNIGASTILGNIGAGNQSPAALSVSDVKTMLSLNNVENTSLSTWTGNAFLSLNGSQLVNSSITSSKFATGSLTMAKMENLPMMTFMGNSSNLTAAYPEAMSVSTVKSLLSLNNVENLQLSTWTGSSNLTVFGTPNNFNVGFLNMNLGTLSTTGASNLVLTAGSGVITTTSTLRLSNITSLGTLSIIPNGGASPLEIWGPLDLKTNTITNVSSINGRTIPTSNIVGVSDTQTLSNKTLSSGSITSGFGSINCTSITTDSISAKTTNTNLVLNGNGTGVPITNNASLWVNSTVTNSDSYLGINGPSTQNSRYIATYQNSVLKCTFGLSSTLHYFIYDIGLNNDMFRAVLGGGQCIRFPTYTNGSLSITSGGVLSSSSDRRLKTNEQILNSANSLQKIMNLQPKSFEWIANPERTEIGFIAQDVELAIPDAVDGKKYEYDFIRDGASSGVEGIVRVDENGIPVMDETRPRYRGLNQCAILSTLVSAFQELVQKNNLLESRITELEGLVVYENA